MIKNILKFLVPGVLFGILLTKAEVISWYRIQEMFLFESFHMYGIIGSAILVAFISTQIIKRFQMNSIDGSSIVIPDKDPTQTKRYLIGGTLFGLGWALTGACPAPLVIHVGAGNLIFIVPILAAIFGTFTYGQLRHKLPH